MDVELYNNEFEIKEDYVVIFLKNKKLGTFECLIDFEDFEKIKDVKLSWHIMKSRPSQSYYAKATEYLGMVDGKFKNRTILMHRFITNCPDDMTIDHLNYNTLDNRRSNMRIVNIDENNKNRRNKPNENTSTGIRNVSWSNRESMYIVQFQINGKNTRMGKFDKLEDAEKYANENRHKYYTNV